MCILHFTPHRAYSIEIGKKILPKISHTKGREIQLTQTFAKEIKSGAYDNPAIYHPAFTALLKLLAADIPKARAFTLSRVCDTYIHPRKFPLCDAIQEIDWAFIWNLYLPEAWTPTAQEERFNEPINRVQFIAEWMARLPEEERPPEVVALLNRKNPNWLRVAIARHERAKANTPMRLLEINLSLATLRARQAAMSEQQSDWITPQNGGKTAIHAPLTHTALSNRAKANPFWHAVAQAITNGYTLEEIRRGTTQPSRRTWRASFEAWSRDNQTLQNTLPAACREELDLSRFRGNNPQKRAKQLAEAALCLIVTNDPDLAAFLNLPNAQALAA